METLYSIEHIRRSLLGGFLSGVLVTFFFMSSKQPDIAIQESVAPIVKTPVVDKGPLPEDIISEVADNMKDPIRAWVVRSYGPLAVSLEAEDGYPASLRIAQMILEAGFYKGNDHGSKAFQEGHNPFGIRWWRPNYPDRVEFFEDRVDGFVQVGRIRYMKFYSVWDAFLVHSDFVTKGHYADYRTDDTYDGWIYALEAGGYAEDKSYGRKLRKIILDNNLNKLDNLNGYL